MAEPIGYELLELAELALSLISSKESLLLLIDGREAALRWKEKWKEVMELKQRTRLHFGITDK